jgi:hypothetical protein
MVIKNICALCQNKEANKTNTHYLTDGIIRSCLNLDGSQDREKGFYFDLSNNSAYWEFNFQRKTSIKKLEESLGRLPTDDEIEKAKQVPFSVDFIFCNDCENIFTSIESNFMDIILPKFRNSDLSKIESLSFSETKLIRLFFYIQIWRSSICEEIIDLSKSVSESLRQIILNHESISDLDLKDFPLTITYLETTGDRREYTTNVVGFTNDTNPLLIFMNDFIRLDVS